MDIATHELFTSIPQPFRRQFVKVIYYVADFKLSKMTVAKITDQYRLLITHANGVSVLKLPNEAMSPHRQ